MFGSSGVTAHMRYIFSHMMAFAVGCNVDLVSHKRSPPILISPMGKKYCRVDFYQGFLLSLSSSKFGIGEQGKLIQIETSKGKSYHGIDLINFGVIFFLFHDIFSMKSVSHFLLRAPKVEGCDLLK